MFTCQKCGTKSTQPGVEAHLTFILSIPKDDYSHINELNDLLPAAFGAAGHHGQCSNCGIECTGSKTNMISAQPDLLCFTINADRLSKYQVHIPDDLDLDPFRSDQITSSLRYRLQAVVELWERDPNFGHYVAYTKIGDEWYLINDKDVSRPAATYEQARSYMKGKQIFCPRLVYYALQYEKGSMPPSPIAASADVSKPQVSEIGDSSQSCEQPNNVQLESLKAKNNRQAEVAPTNVGGPGAQTKALSPGRKRKKGKEDDAAPPMKSSRTTELESKQAFVSASLQEIIGNLPPRDQQISLQVKRADPDRNQQTAETQTTSDVQKDRHSQHSDQAAPRDQEEASKQSDVPRKCKRKREAEAGPISTKKSARTEDVHKNEIEKAKADLKLEKIARKSNKKAEQEKTKIAEERTKNAEAGLKREKEGAMKAKAELKREKEKNMKAEARLEREKQI